MKHQYAETQQQPHFNHISISRLLASASRKSLRRIGVPTKRFSSLRWRISTRANPMPHMAAFIRFIPISPGIRKSM